MIMERLLEKVCIDDARADEPEQQLPALKDITDVAEPECLKDVLSADLSIFEKALNDDADVENVIRDKDSYGLEDCAASRITCHL